MVTYIRQIISVYPTDGEEFESPREGYVLYWASVLEGTGKWALIWGPDDEDEDGGVTWV